MKMLFIHAQVIRNAETTQRVNLGLIPVAKIAIINTFAVVTNGSQVTGVVMSSVRGVNRGYLTGAYSVTSTAAKFEYPYLPVDKNDNLDVDITGGTQGDIIDISLRGIDEENA